MLEWYDGWWWLMSTLSTKNPKKRSTACWSNAVRRCFIRPPSAGGQGSRRRPVRHLWARHTWGSTGWLCSSNEKPLSFQLSWETEDHEWCGERRWRKIRREASCHPTMTRILPNKLLPCTLSEKSRYCKAWLYVLYVLYYIHLVIILLLPHEEQSAAMFSAWGNPIEQNLFSDMCWWRWPLGLAAKEPKAGS